MCSLALFCFSKPSSTQTLNPQTRTGQSGEILFKADDLRHDRELGVVVATGSVEMVEGERILRADRVSYNKKKDLVTATGNVVLMEPDGEVIFSDHVELTEDFKTGIVENIWVLMIDNARMAAVGGRRIGGEKMELHKAVYSPCRTCSHTPEIPLWQIKAFNVFHDKTEQNIEYRDAFMEFFGVPVFYTPYFSHPDSTVKRRSGFLTPRYGSNTILGATLETPYYFNIAPDKDATIRPISTTNEGIVLAAEYRQRFSDAQVMFRGSGTRGTTSDGDQDFRGHLFSYISADINNSWRAGAKFRLTSDDTYLQRYDFYEADTLKSHAFIEGFNGQNYASAKGIFWRGLRNADDPATMPLIAPTLDLNFINPVGQSDAQWKFDANFLSLTRSEGTDSKRLSLINSLELPHITATGHVYHLYASLQTDAYYGNNVQFDSGDTSTGFSGRIFPRIGMDWRFPFSRIRKNNTQILEPVAGLQFSPNGGNPQKISNEDSQDIEFDETNLFSRSRFTGLDRVEGGHRIYYGLRLGYINPNGYSDGFIGQSYRLRDNNDFAANTGLKDHFSDIVGRLSIRPSPYLDLQYRFRLDKDDFSARRNELAVNAGPSILKFNLNYSFFDEGSGSGEFADREEVTYGFSSQFSKSWSLNASTRRDLHLSNTLTQGVGLSYVCDCFTMNLSLIRTFTHDRDVKPSDTLFLQLIFKNLGGVFAQTDSNKHNRIQ
jgi:LPS-assembly protein